MRVRVLGTYGYRGRLDYEWGEYFADPSSADIEAAIRRLDAGEFAGVVLHKNDHRDGEPATGSFAVTGGAGCYLVTCFVASGSEIAITDPDIPEGKHLVGVCERDQGVWVSERKVCRDLQVALDAARHYAATGEPWPAVHWE